MRTLGASTDQAKVAIGWISEKFGRLKLNGELREPSPLSPLIELEGLSLGIEGKRLLWISLLETEPIAERIGRERLQRADRARGATSATRVEVHRREAARRAFTALAAPGAGSGSHRSGRSGSAIARRREANAIAPAISGSQNRITR